MTKQQKNEDTTVSGQKNEMNGQGTTPPEQPKPQMTAQERDSLSLLLTKSRQVRSSGMDPAHIKVMGVLNEKAKAAGLKIQESICSKCHKVYITVEGSTLAGCHFCCQGRLI